MDRSQSVLVSPTKIEGIASKSRSLSPSPARDPSLSISTPSHLSTSTPPHPSKEKKEKETFPPNKVDRRDVEKDLCTQKKTLLCPLFKIIFDDEKSVEGLCNFPKAPVVISCIRDPGNYLKVWDPPAEAKDALAELRMVQMGTQELKNHLRFCAGRGPVLLHRSLYRVLKQTLVILS